MMETKHLFLGIIVSAFIVSCASLDKNSDEPGIANINKGKIQFDGTYNILVADYKGVLTIKKEHGIYSGTIYFENWGNGTPGILKKLSIRDRKIYFIRSEETVEEMARVGANRPFKQEFFGEYQTTGSFIKGYYTDGGIENKWQAKRK